jgi:hypothetical protein
MLLDMDSGNRGNDCVGLSQQAQVSAIISKPEKNYHGKKWKYINMKSTGIFY